MAYTQLTAATGVLTLAANIADTDEITIGDITYVVTDSSPDPEQYQFAAGGSADLSVAIIANAINGDIEDMPAHPAVTAVASTANDTVTLTARVGGAIGNSVGTSTSEVDITFGATTLEGGVGDAAQLVSDILAYEQCNASVISALRSLTPGVD